jgi:arylsulfatase A-like enzyme
MRTRYIVLILFLVVVACTREPVDRTPTPHLILISLDTARADHFGFMGNTVIRTPHLDEIAGQSIVFTNYMTVVPTTLASHVSLFTGKYPHNHGTPRNGFMVNPDNIMLPEVMKSAGYHTAGFAACFAIESRFGFDQGFDHYDQRFDMLPGIPAAGQDQRAAQSVTDAVIGYLDREGIPEHLFLFVHYFDPHQPYAAPPPYDRLYDPLGRNDALTADFVKAHKGESSARVKRQVGRIEHQYAAEFTYMDHHLGRLFEYLRGQGVLDQAVVVITSDHGESLWEHGEEFNHGFTVFQSTMHCICMIRLPGGELGGTRSDRPTASVDILPTVLQQLSIAIPEAVDGQTIDLRGVDGPSGQTVRFGQASKPWEKIETDPRWTNIMKPRCIRRGDYKFIQTPYLGTEQLYDVAKDPAEIMNLLDEPSTGISALADELRPQLEAWAVSGNPLPSGFEPRNTEETVKRLKSLGYLR